MSKLLRRIPSPIRIALVAALILTLIAGVFTLLLGLFYVFVLGDIPMQPEGIHADAWLDENGDGRHQFEETSVGGACIWASADILAYKESSTECKVGRNITGGDGNWYTNSSQAVYVFAVPPAGYEYTTPPIVKAERHSAQFGFVSDDVVVQSHVYSADYYASMFLEQDKKDKIAFYLIGGSVLMVLLYVAWLISEKLASTK